MPERTKGLFYPDGSFKSERKIRREYALRGELPEMETPLAVERDWRYWSQRFIQRAESYQEASPYKENHVTLRLADPALVCWIGDGHLGSPNTNYKRIEQEAELVLNTPNSVLVLGGDMVDGFFWNPAQFEQVEQTPEQYQYLRAFIKTMSKENKLIAAWGGDHDGWAKKVGIDPYSNFANETGAYYLSGVGHMTVKVGEQEYYFTAAHQLPGSSIYNNSHPGIRASKEIQGADAYINFHTHRKGHLEQPIKLFGDESRWIHSISAGPYKGSDDYSRKKGWARQNAEDMFGFALELSGDRKDITYHKDIVEAHRKFTNG